MSCGRWGGRRRQAGDLHAPRPIGPPDPLLCNAFFYRSSPRLARPLFGLEHDELLGAVVERLLKALQDARPETVRGFFAPAGRHAR